MSILDGELTSLAFCWQLERKDGSGLALTSHDRSLTIDGVRHEPSPGMTPAAIRAERGLEARSSEVAGSLSSTLISETDIESGRWDGATVRLMAVDWSSPEQEQVDLLEGELGLVSSKGGKFEAELLGVASKLERPICPLTSPECRAELGDPQCRVDMAGRRLRARISSIEGQTIRVDQPVDNRFHFGRLRFLGGAANGLQRRILSVTGNALLLTNMGHLDVEPGLPVELAEGCDKRLETCASRFGNSVNFRGEPHLPGNDLLTRYPGA